MGNLNHDSHDIVCFFFLVLIKTAYLAVDKIKYIFLPATLTARGGICVTILHQAKYECQNQSFLPCKIAIFEL